MDITSIITILIGSVTAIITGFMSFRNAKGKSEAEEEKIHADTVVTFADGWKNYALDVERRLKESDELHKQEIAELRGLIETIQIQSKEEIKKKDEHILLLEARIDELEKEVLKYRGIETKVDSVKEGLHEDVESKLDELKQK